MEAHSINMWISVLLYFIYGGICIVALIFTFSVETYYKIDGVFNLEMVISQFINPLLDRRVGTIEAWLIKRNRFVGPILIVLSLVDLKLTFNLINNLYFYAVVS